MSEGRLRLPAMLVASFYLFLAVVALVTMLGSPYQMDFVAYWAAGRLTAAGDPAAAYDLAAHRAVELSAIPLSGGLPFAYPPLALPLFAPFGWLDYPAAAVDWVLLSFAGFAIAIRRWAPTLAFLPFAFPPLLINAINGQAGFLTGACFIGGMLLLPRRPVLAGLLLGLLAMKPQLVLFVPVALIAGREWRALAGAAAMAAGLALLSLLLFGWAPWQAWADNAGQIAAIATEGLAGWHRMASVYAMLRMAGLDALPAFLLHLIVAFAAAVVVAWLWFRRAPFPSRAGALAAASALASPYLFSYDLVLLVLPFLYLIGRGRLAILAGLGWAILFLGLVQVLGWGGGPNLVPLAPILFLVAILIDQVRGLSTSESETEPDPRGAALG